MRPLKTEIYVTEIDGSMYYIRPLTVAEWRDCDEQPDDIFNYFVLHYGLVNGVVGKNHEAYLANEIMTISGFGD